MRRIHVQRRHLADERPDGEEHPEHQLELLQRHRDRVGLQTEGRLSSSCSRSELLSSHLVLRDPRLLPAVPLAVVQTAAITVEDVQVMDRHLTHTHTHTLRRYHHFTRRIINKTPFTLPLSSTICLK